MIEPKPYLLKNKIQKYAWGTKNENAFIPKLLNEIPERDVPYAELWIGAHPKAPSAITIDKKELHLDELINRYPVEILGNRVAEKFSNKLPYLLKVLSCETALSIQTHPDKKLAKILHKNDPKNYPDENHKPEIAIALDELKALIGFKSISDIRNIIIKYPFLEKAIPSYLFEQIDKKSRNVSEILEEFYSIIMKLEQNRLKEIINGIKSQLDQSEKLTIEEEEFIKQYKVYGIDVGLLSILIFNIVELNNGEAIYTEAGIPHAYLYGNIVECMANSDNVIRAGLTPKFKDVDTLLSMVNYKDTPPEILRPINNSENIYRTSAEEFEVTNYKMDYKTKLKLNSKQIIIGLVTEGSIEISYQNSVENYSKGDSFLIPAILEEFSIQSEEYGQFMIVQVPLD